jgi:glucan phosphoethanolaminetransferase (alkaline phosphatase superfamily)
MIIATWREQYMFMNIIVNLILTGILYGLYLWTAWASLVLATLSSIAFSYQLFFDKEYIDKITPTNEDKLSIIFGSLISYLGVVVSIVVLLK